MNPEDKKCSNCGHWQRKHHNDFYATKGYGICLLCGSFAYYDEPNSEKLPCGTIYHPGTDDEVGFWEPQRWVEKLVARPTSRPRKEQPDPMAMMGLVLGGFAEYGLIPADEEQ